MKLRRFGVVVLIATLASFYLQGQNKPHNYFSSFGYYHNLSGGDFHEMSGVSFTYRIYPSSTVGATLYLGGSMGSKMANDHNTQFYSLLVTRLPVDEERLRIIPSMGFGVLNRKDDNGRYVKIFMDTSVEVQYSVTDTSYCGFEYRCMSNGWEYFSYHFIGSKIGFYF